MVVAPSTNLVLLRSPLEEGDDNQLDFADSTAQYNYFISLPHIEVDQFTYQRKDNVIRMRGNFDALLKYNYVIYQNEEYSDKWFYAYITKIEYVNDSTTYLYIKTDVFQTWQFDLSYKETFIEREHISNDVPGANTVPEGLDIGEPVISSGDSGVFNLLNSSLPWNDMQVCFQVSELIGNMQPPTTSESGGYNPVYNGIFSGLFFFSAGNPNEARRVIDGYAAAGKSEAIVAIFQIPNGLTSGLSQPITVTGETLTVTFTINWVLNSDGFKTLKTGTVNRLESIGETNNRYTPRNKKLLTYPYLYLYASNYSGQQEIYRFEDFNSGAATFSVLGAISQGCSIRLVPQNFKSTSVQRSTNDFGLTGGKLPICAWATDYYTNWCTQNAVNLKTDVANTLLGTSSNLLQRNLIGAALGATQAITNTMAQVESAKLVPNQASGQVNCGDINMAMQQVGFSATVMSVRKEYAMRLDGYFDMFGYKTNMVKLPNITGRQNWNFVKTIDCYIEGDTVPQDDLNEIKGLFNNGIRIWHNPVTFMDYSQPNNVV